MKWGKAAIRSRTEPWAILLATFLALPSCSALGPAPGGARPNTYLLQWEQPGKAQATLQLEPGCPTLLLTRPRAAPGYVGARMAYTEQAHRIDYFANHRWADAPAQMLEPLLLHALESSGLFAAVVQAPTAVHFDLRLDTEILRLVQIFESTSSHVELVVRISLVDMTQRRVLLSDVLQVTEPARERTPYAGVVAANLAVARLLEHLQQSLHPIVSPRCLASG